MGDRPAMGIEFEIALGDIGVMAEPVDQDVIPGPVVRWAAEGDLVVPLLGTFEDRIDVDDDAAVVGE